MMSILKSLLLFVCGFILMSSHEPNRGEIIDMFNNIPVYYNGGMSNVSGRNVAPGGYNLGLKYQCVEFVKRYYYYHLRHRMPDSYGHAKDFFDKELPDRAYNEARALVQFRNTREYLPQAEDILVYGASRDNPYGHLALITQVTNDHVEIIQQNWGNTTRKKIKLAHYRGIYTVADQDVLGWLRLPSKL